MSYTIIAATLVGLYGVYYLSKNKKQPVKAPKPNTIEMIDNIDHMWSVFDLISPKPNAFDKPQMICNQIKAIPQDIPIKLVLQTNGGGLSACEKILKQLKKHPAGYIAYIKRECFSAGTILALGAKEIVMIEDSYLGKIDPQVSSITTSYSVILYANLEDKYVTDKNIDKVRQSKQVLNHMDLLLDLIFTDPEVKTKVTNKMIYSELPHYKTFDMQECLDIGLNVRKPTIEEVGYFQ